MAYTKIHAIKTTVDKSITYICNPDKTDEKISLRKKADLLFISERRNFSSSIYCSSSLK